MKTTMRIISICTVLSVFLLMLPISSFAAEIEYEVPDVNINIEIPEDYYVFIRDTDANEEQLNDLGIDLSELRNVMNEKNIYLDAISSDTSEEIAITMVDGGTIDDFRQYNNSTLISFIEREEAQKEFKSNGIELIKYDEFYDHPQAKFMILEEKTSLNESSVYSVQYYTIYNNKAINITLVSYNGKVTSAQKELLRSIVQTVSFNDASNYSTNTKPINNNPTNNDPTYVSKPNESNNILLTIVLSLLFTMVFHILPIIVYKHIIKKGEPTNPKKARIIVIVEAIIIFVISIVIDFIVIIKSGVYALGTNTVAITFWSFICYRILTKGYKDPSTEQPILKRYPKDERYWRKRITGIKKIMAQEISSQRQQELVDYLYANAYISSIEKTDIESLLNLEGNGTLKDRLQKYLMIPSDETFFILTWTDEKIDERENAINMLAAFEGTEKDLEKTVQKYIFANSIFVDEQKELIEEILTASDEQRPVDLSVFSLLEYKGLKSAANQLGASHPLLQRVDDVTPQKKVETAIPDTKAKKKEPVQDQQPRMAIRSETPSLTKKTDCQEKKILSINETPLSGEMKKCSHCGREIMLESEFCNYCGSKQEQLLFCRKCGARLLSDSMFCNHCGTKVIKL